MGEVQLLCFKMQSNWVVFAASFNTFGLTRLSISYLSISFNASVANLDALLTVLSRAIAGDDAVVETSEKIKGLSCPWRTKSYDRTKNDFSIF
jgi:hypothetical protein